MNPDESKPGVIVWRGIRLESHSPGVWVSADRMWKLFSLDQQAHCVAYLQLDAQLLIVESAETPEAALTRLAYRATQVAEKLTNALRPVAVAPTDPNELSSEEARRAALTVHVLHHGRALCGKPGVPGKWEPGHKWVRLDSDESGPRSAVNCDGCMRALHEDPLAWEADGWEIFARH